MFDFTITSITKTGTVICTLFYFCVVLIFWNTATTKEYQSSKKQTLILFLLVLLFSIISWTNGDWFHYLEGVRNFMGESTMEEVYDSIIIFTHQNYFLFRFIIWGGALLFFSYAVIEFKVDLYKCLFLLFIVFINYFDYARASLGMATYFLGLSILICDRRYIVKFLGILILVSSIFFHRSMFMLIILTPFCFFPITKKNLIILSLIVLIGFGLMEEFFSYLFNDLLESDDEALVGTLSQYESTGDRESVSSNFLGLLIYYWHNSIFYVIYGYILYLWLKLKLNLSIKNNIKVLFGISTGILLLSTIFYFFNNVHPSFYYRVRTMAFIPLCILCVYLFSNGYITPKAYKILLYYCGGYVGFVFLQSCFFA